MSEGFFFQSYYRIYYFYFLLLLVFKLRDPMTICSWMQIYLPYCLILL